LETSRCRFTCFEKGLAAAATVRALSLFLEAVVDWITSSLHHLITSSLHHLITDDGSEALMISSSSCKASFPPAEMLPCCTKIYTLRTGKRGTFSDNTTAMTLTTAARR
jgi:hypothetical protein